MADDRVSQSENPKTTESEKKDNKNCKISKEINEVSAGEGVESNLQTPLMFSRCSSLGSLSGFERNSFRDDQSSIVSDFSPRASGAVSPSINQNGISEIVTKLQVSDNNSNSQIINEKRQCDELYVSKTKIQLQEKINVPDIPFQYDIAFKKPHFFKHSVFEDDIAAFKDESSPNFLSTAASSLSSLTIDDEDYGDNTLPNKAGLLKKKLLSTEKSQSEKISVSECCHQDPIGTCEFQQAYRRIVSKELSNNNQQNSPSKKLDDRSSIVIQSSQTLYISHENQSKEQQKRLDWVEHNMNETQKINGNPIIHNSKNIQNIDSQTNDNANEFNFKRDLLVQKIQRDKIQNLHYNGKFIQETRIESDIIDKYTHKHNGYEKFHKEERDFAKQNKVSQGFCKTYNDSTNSSHSTEENNDLNAYEEQLLDQCIRTGMAKVTKRNITDIKPFCWDLNQICLTTRAMFKNHSEDIIRDRRGEYNKQRLLQRGSMKKIINSKTK